MHQKNCEQCEKPFTSKNHKARFCGKDCSHKGRVSRITITCQTCQTPFEVMKGRLAQGYGKFCSRACAYAHQPLEDRFWPKVQKTDTCWLWTGSRDLQGYGRIGTGGRRSTPILTHRVSWVMHHGSIPEGMLVCHHCDNPSCVRPDHLFLGTNADNVQDMIAKKRHAHGEQAPWSKVTKAQVIEIRQRYASGIISQYSLAKEYDINHATISAIVRRLIWDHVS